MFKFLKLLKRSFKLQFKIPKFKPLIKSSKRSLKFQRLKFTLKTMLLFKKELKKLKLSEKRLSQSRKPSFKEFQSNKLSKRLLNLLLKFQRSLKLKRLSKNLLKSIKLLNSKPFFLNWLKSMKLLRNMLIKSSKLESDNKLSKKFQLKLKRSFRSTQRTLMLKKFKSLKKKLLKFQRSSKLLTLKIMFKTNFKSLTDSNKLQSQSTQP